MSAALPTPAVRVVCVVYHPGDELDRFVDTLSTATTRTVELVLVDNGADQSRAQAVCERVGARLRVPGRNLGYGAAANLGAIGAQTPWLVVANPDIEWSPGSLDALLDCGDGDPAAGAVGPQVRDPDGVVYPSARAVPSLRQGAGHAVLSRVWPTNPWTRGYQARQETVGAGRRSAGWLSGSCLLLRRAAFEQVGGFDEGYFMFFEDVDLGERLGCSGWRNVYEPAARVTHVGGTSWRSEPEPMIRAHHASARRYLARRYHRWYQAPVRWATAAGLGLRELSQVRSARRTR